MSYWDEQSKGMNRELLNHKWAGMLRDFLHRRNVDAPESMILVHVHNADEAYRDEMADSGDEQVANELAMEALFPRLLSDDDDEDQEDEEWELEGGLEDFVVGLESYLGQPVGDPINEDDDEDYVRMALQPGTTKQIDGKTYILNQNHRWTLPEDLEKNSETPIETGSAPETPTGPPSPMAVRTASSEGDSPEQRQARQEVSLWYLSNKAVYYDPKSKSMLPLDESRISGMLDGIDLSKPVTLGPPPGMPPPARLAQWQAEGGYRGSYFSTPEATPEQLGIYENAVAWNVEGQPVLPRKKKLYPTTNKVFKKTSYLRSVAAPTVDTWSVPSEEKKVAGGGLQWFVPVAAHPDLRVKEIKMSNDQKPKPTIQQAITATEKFLSKARDPAMTEVYNQLQMIAGGKEFKPTIATIIVRNFDPAPTEEIAEWCQLVLDATHGN